MRISRLIASNASAPAEGPHELHIGTLPGRAFAPPMGAQNGLIIDFNTFKSSIFSEMTVHFYPWLSTLFKILVKVRSFTLMQIIVQFLLKWSTTDLSHSSRVTRLTIIKYLECSRLQRRQTLVRAAADLEPVQSIKANQLNDKRFKVKYSDHTLSNRIQILDC